jgi:hypothetical protein
MIAFFVTGFIPGVTTAEAAFRSKRRLAAAALQSSCINLSALPLTLCAAATAAQVTAKGVLRSNNCLLQQVLFKQKRERRASSWESHVGNAFELGMGNQSLVK